MSPLHTENTSHPMSTASTFNAPAQTTIPGSSYQVTSDQEVYVLSGYPMSAARMYPKPDPLDRPHGSTSETNTQIGLESLYRDTTSEIDTTIGGSVITVANERPAQLHEILLQPASAVTFWEGAGTPALKEVSNLTTGIKALVARCKQGYEEGCFKSQEGRLITQDDSGRKTEIRVYILNSLYMFETYFRLPNKNYPLDLIEFQDSAQMMRLPYYQAIHEALETRRRAVLSVDGNCQSNAYINQALSDISSDIAGCGYDVIQVVGDGGNHEVWATYKIPGDDHLYVASYAWRSSIRATETEGSVKLTSACSCSSMMYDVLLNKTGRTVVSTGVESSRNAIVSRPATLQATSSHSERTRFESIAEEAHALFKSTILQRSTIRLPRTPPGNGILVRIAPLGRRRSLTTLGNPFMGIQLSNMLAMRPLLGIEASVDLSAQPPFDLFSVMQLDLNSQTGCTASTASSQLSSIVTSTSGDNKMRLPDRSSSSTPASDREARTATQGSNIASTPTVGASVEDTLPLGPASTDDIFAWPVAGVRYSPDRAYESSPNGTVICALWALVCQIVRAKSSKGPSIVYNSFMFLPGIVGGQRFPIKVTTLREVVLGTYFDLYFGVQVHTGLLPDKMRSIQNAMNESYETTKHLTAQAVRCVLSQKGFKVLEISFNPLHGIIWARYKHPDSNDQHIAGYSDAASIENA
ncbi:hypothetical protein FFLO_05220 [Filobasidium floriforme]|uniref:Uncharacterized protein n=1 Tax=Filobasidium floriforme TaxID=5210 RepID=A0A8K0NP61_9TREE|nr:uncharacterized protein HD553DRAFT_322755 [Filobasidium floriforme]KAG7530172.1 hypothetical protein FFLO_05220 [Filobasidium floriforme]KAH8087247.1 hypothetical protein HD553DRAFT_322755 [Filobasidium floriforme]